MAAHSLEKKRMTEHFMLSSRYEYMFWQQAYGLESWPV
jgi:thiaminase/transcriptional activator TenA